MEIPNHEMKTLVEKMAKPGRDMRNLVKILLSVGKTLGTLFKKWVDGTLPDRLQGVYDSRVVNIGSNGVLILWMACSYYCRGIAMGILELKKVV